MRLMVMVKSDEKSEAGVLPDEKMLQAMGEYNEALIKAGVMLAGDGLKASAHGSRVQINGKTTRVIDGPFAEAKELVGGFWILKTKTLAEAVELLKRAPLEEGAVELRPIYETEDFPVDPAEKTDGWREQEERMREAAAAAPPPRLPGTRRYFVALKADKNTEAGVFPENTEQLFTEMGALMNEAAQSGALLGGDGLKPTSAGARILYSGSKRTVVDGPFTESKELIAGYSIIQTKTKAEAIEFARRMLAIHVKGTDIESGECEVREYFEIEDFPVSPEEKPDGWRKVETAFRDHHA